MSRLPRRAWGGVRYIIDITIAWSTDTGGVEWRDVGFDADKRAASKDASYAKSLERERRGGVGWFESVRLSEADVFVPLAYDGSYTKGGEICTQENSNLHQALPPQPPEYSKPSLARK